MPTAARTTQFKAQRIAEVSRPDALAAGAQEIALEESSKSKPAVVQVAAAKAARATVAKAASGETKVASAAPSSPALVPATFQAAPSAYASEEPKSSTLGALKSLFGQSAETPQSAPAVDAQPVATVVSVADTTPTATVPVNAPTGKHPKAPSTAPIATTTTVVPSATTPATAQDEPKVRHDGRAEGLAQSGLG